MQLVFEVHSHCNMYHYFISFYGCVSPVAQKVKHLPVMWKTQVRSLGWEDPLEKAMETHSSILAENPMDRGAW